MERRRVADVAGRAGGRQSTGDFSRQLSRQCPRKRKGLAGTYPLTPVILGGEPGTRTQDQRIMIPLLYQLS